MASLWHLRLDFNPRSREGSDALDHSAECGMTNFNPRSREGSDTRPDTLFCIPSHFNPRSR